MAHAPNNITICFDLATIVDQTQFLSSYDCQSNRLFYAYQKPFKFEMNFLRLGLLKNEQNQIDLKLSLLSYRCLPKY